MFIPYSHNDEKEALYLAFFLQKKGISVFLDSILWHSVGGPLDAIDQKYSWAFDHKHYDTVKRNFSTSHVHVMLSMAMLEEIKRYECCLFVESPHSMTLPSGIENHTLSPWIIRVLGGFTYIKTMSNFQFETALTFCSRRKYERF